MAGGQTEKKDLPNYISQLVRQGRSLRATLRIPANQALGALDFERRNAGASQAIGPDIRHVVRLATSVMILTHLSFVHAAQELEPDSTPDRPRPCSTSKVAGCNVTGPVFDR